MDIGISLFMVCTTESFGTRVLWLFPLLYASLSFVGGAWALIKLWKVILHGYKKYLDRLLIIYAFYMMISMMVLGFRLILIMKVTDYHDSIEAMIIMVIIISRPFEVSSLVWFEKSIDLPVTEVHISFDQVIMALFSIFILVLTAITFFRQY
ncbi:MAG: hypothetical protein ACFFG0_07655 [Candidatus Thorarchaeota archaeon]